MRFRRLQIFVTAWLVVGVACQESDRGARGPEVGNPAADSGRRASAVLRLPRRPVSPIPLHLEPAFPRLRLARPLVLLQSPGESRWWYVVGQAGQVWKVPDDRQSAVMMPVLDISDQVAPPTDDGNQGLLGMAFDPAFATNGTAYIFYVTAGEGPDPCPPGMLSAVRMDAFGERFVRQSEREILRVAPACSSGAGGPHRVERLGGTLGFDADGYLILALGDGGDARAAGDPESLAGSILRVNVRTRPYAIPPGNPFAQGGGRPEVYAFGFGHPRRWSLDRKTGSLWIGDAGGDGFEEIDVLEVGGDHGWPNRDGAACRRKPCSSQEVVPPVAAWPREDGCDVVGGYVYRGREIAELTGAYVFGERCSGRVQALFLGESGAPERVLLLEAESRVVSFAEGTDGELLVLQQEGEIMRLRPGSSR